MDDELKLAIRFYRDAALSGLSLALQAASIWLSWWLVLNTTTQASERAFWSFAYWALSPQYTVNLAIAFVGVIYEWCDCMLKRNSAAKRALWATNRHYGICLQFVILVQTFFELVNPIVDPEDLKMLANYFTLVSLTLVVNVALMNS